MHLFAESNKCPSDAKRVGYSYRARGIYTLACGRVNRPVFLFERVGIGKPPESGKLETEPVT